MDSMIVYLVYVISELMFFGLLDVHCYNNHIDPGNSLALWIDGKEIEQFVGVPMDIYVVRDGIVVPYLQDAHMGLQLPVLPPEVYLVRLSWQAPDGIYTYQFSDLKSLDPHVMFNPLISIPPEGIVPHKPSEFQMAISCTGQETGIASMYITLHIQNERLRPIRGSPLRLHLRKRCIAIGSQKECRYDCKNEGRCNDMGECDCKKGFYGTQCELAACVPLCENNGTCYKPGFCQCQRGYTGDRCETAVCMKPCHHQGRCIGPELCECVPGYYGNYCQHKSGKCPIPCKNGGTCLANDKCSCQPGYMGHFCQKPICRRSCGVHGRCVDVDRCECYQGWRGRFCHKTIHMGLKHKDNIRSRKARRKRNRKTSIQHYRNNRWRPNHDQNEEEGKPNKNQHRTRKSRRKFRRREVRRHDFRRHSWN